MNSIVQSASRRRRYTMPSTLARSVFSILALSSAAPCAGTAGGVLKGRAFMSGARDETPTLTRLAAAAAGDSSQNEHETISRMRHGGWDLCPFRYQRTAR